ncbi:MAG: PAS domain-containing protein [Bryobacterales bacterium]|nr:PAS domain-containing protein [Bryobacterales bacterium]
MAGHFSLRSIESAEHLISELRGTLGKMDLALGSITEAIAWTTARGTLEWCNAPFENLVGERRLTLIGRDVLELLPLEQDGTRVPRQTHPLTRGIRGELVEAEAYELPGQTTRSVEVSARALCGTDRKTSTVIVVRDVTRRKEREHTLLQHQEFLALLQRVTNASNDAEDESQAIGTVLELVCTRRHWCLGHASLFAQPGSWEDLIPTGIWFTECHPSAELRQWLEQRPFLLSKIADTMLREERPIQTLVEGPLGPVDATAIPVVSGREIVGMLEFYHSSRDTDDLDDLAQIGVQLGRVIERKRAEHELREAHAELELRVMDRTFELAEANNALRRENEERRKAEAAKNELVATVSHELRTPLASLLGFAELMLDNEFSRDEQCEFLQVIHQESQRLTDMINDFLDLQRIEAGRMDCRLQPIELEPLLRDCARLFTKEDGTHPIEVEAANLPLVMADGKRLRQVLTNLISNAVKFSPNGGTVRMKASGEGDQVLVMVEDHGLGIPFDMIPKLFQKFVRVDNADTRKIGGTGLGLALIKEIIQLHNGDIWVESQLGIGSRFFFTIPVAPPPPA